MESYRNYGSGNGRGYGSRCVQPRGMNQYQNRGYGSTCNMPKMDSCPCNDMPYNLAENGECEDANKHMRHMPVGMGYVPVQPWGELYDPQNALSQGTAFPDLNLIFCGVRGKM